MFSSSIHAQDSMQNRKCIKTKEILEKRFIKNKIITTTIKKNKQETDLKQKKRALEKHFFFLNMNFK